MNSMERKQGAVAAAAVDYNYKYSRARLLISILAPIQATSSTQSGHLGLSRACTITGPRISLFPFRWFAAQVQPTFNLNLFYLNFPVLYHSIYIFF